MTTGAQRDQVFEAVGSKLASRVDVMHLKVLSGATILAAPTVSRENLSAKSLVRAGVQSNPRSSRC